MIFEVCCGCAEDAVNAVLGGADRIELNSALFMGGLTPSLGTLIEVKKKVKLPVMAMVRPREGGFCYRDEEYAVMLKDAELLLKNGADGLVFGFLNADGSIDKKRTKEFVALCNSCGKNSVFSRAIDVCPDIPASLKVLEELGVTRVLTSGGKPSALDGAEMIANMVKQAEKIQILPGGGIRYNNVTDLIDKTGVTQVHCSARKLYRDTSVLARPEIYFGGSIDGKFIPEHEYKITDIEAVSKMRDVLDKVKER